MNAWYWAVIVIVGWTVVGFSAWQLLMMWKDGEL